MQNTPLAPCHHVQCRFKSLHSKLGRLPPLATRSSFVRVITLLVRCQKLHSTKAGTKPDILINI